MSDQPLILVVDDDPSIRDALAIMLERANYSVQTAANGRNALASVAAAAPSLILLDVMMPELNGIEVASRLRANPDTADIPIIMLTARGEELDELVGLQVGADDYVAKPYSNKVLVARIEAVLRRAAASAAGGADTTGDSNDQRGLSLGPIRINTDTHEVTLDGSILKLTLTEFRVLTSLVEAEGRVLSRSTLIAEAIGPGITVTERTIDVHVTAIRKKLGGHSGIIQTVRGVGYRATLVKDESVSHA